jgi:transcription initiation factor TFIIB
MSAPTMERDVPDVCGECGSTDLVEDTKNGDLVCAQCGVVAAELLIDLGHEWRTFENDDSAYDPNRVGGSINPLLDSGLATSISQGPAGANALNERLARAQSRNVLDANDRYVTECYNRISYLCERSGLPQLVKDRACELLRLYYDHLTLGADGVRARARFREDETASIISAALFIACRNEGFPRTFNEISVIVSVAKSRVAAYVKAMEMSIGEAAKISRIRTTDDFVSRFCSYLEIPNIVRSLVNQVARAAAEKDGIHGRTLVSIAAGAIYFVLLLWRETCPQSIPATLRVSDEALVNRIAEVSGITEGVVKTVASRIRQYRDRGLLPPDWVRRFPSRLEPELPTSSSERQDPTGNELIHEQSAPTVSSKRPRQGSR